MAYTLQDLETAKAEFNRWQESWANDTSGNPDVFRAQRRQAAGKVREIEEELKASGVLPKTEQEKLHDELDNLYPNIKSKSIVTHQGKRYQIRYFPLDTSRSGKTVFEWGHRWVLLD